MGRFLAASRLKYPFCRFYCEAEPSGDRGGRTGCLTAAGGLLPVLLSWAASEFKHLASPETKSDCPLAQRNQPLLPVAVVVGPSGAVRYSVEAYRSARRLAAANRRVGKAVQKTPPRATAAA